MGSFFLFIFAVWFTVVTFPIWFIIGIFYGLIISVIKYFDYFSRTIDGYCRYHDFCGEGILLFVIAIPMAIWDGIVAFFDPVSFAWDFARYDHPFWAFLISFILTNIYKFALSDNDY
jgi:hypothetical protein